MTKITKTVNEYGTIIYKNEKGERHNENGPAVTTTDGSKSWWQNGKCHNENGPAILWANGRKTWFLEGISYSEQEWKNELFKRCFK